MVIVDQEGQLFMDRSQSFMNSHEDRGEVELQFAKLKQEAGDSEKTIHMPGLAWTDPRSAEAGGRLREDHTCQV